MRTNSLIFASNTKGELIMKKTILSLALVIAFVFAFTAVAQATFRGFTPVRTQSEIDAGAMQGFITFAEAQAEMTRNNVPAALQNSAHGGYVTTTTKCATCHSAHRATGINPDAVQGSVSGSAGGTNAANVQNQLFLTAGDGTCQSCHVSSGSQASTLLVEWGNPGGPHAGAGSQVGGACALCHNAGVHGLTGSQFNVMNVYMLGNVRRTTSSTTVAETRDAQIAREILEGSVLRGQVLDVPVGNSIGATPVVADPSAASTWWYNGDRSLGAVGTTPPAFGAGITAGGTQFGAARSLATAYTCGEAGCHMGTAMFNLNWGMGFDRYDMTNGTPGSSSDWSDTIQVTGHVMPSVRTTGGANNACGPCHAGNPAGFPTASTVAGARDVSRIAYGCDQCHDMVGVATNSTAWPHGNRNILVYEWLEDGTQIETTVGAGNLWMYNGNIARALHGADGVTVNSTANGGQGAFTSFRGPTSENPNFADNSWRVLTGVTAGRNGLPGTGAGLQDGSCLKCHVPLDSASREALGSMGADALQHAWNRGNVPGHGTPLEPTWDGNPVGHQSGRLFLYK